MTPDRIEATLAELWAAYGDVIVLGSGALLAVVLAVLGVYLAHAAKAGKASRLIAGYTFAASLFWMAEGQFEVLTADGGFDLPWWVALFGCAVFEGFLAGAYFQASEHRTQFGHPGPAGTRMWALAAGNGAVAAMAADAWSERGFRILIPLMAVWGMWHVLLAARDTDTEEMRAAREQSRLDREATWAITPRTLLVKAGVMRPGKTTVTDAERERLVGRIVDLAERAALAKPEQRRKFELRLRQAARGADEDMLAEAGRRVRRARGAVALVSDLPAADVDQAADEPVGEPFPDPWEHSTPVTDEPVREPVAELPSEPTPEPVAEPNPEPVREPVNRPARKRTTPKSLTSAERVTRAHQRDPDATHERIAELARVSVATVKRYRPKTDDTGSPSGPDAAETAPADRLNGAVPELAGQEA